MHCGCISTGDVRCTACQRTVRYLERYLAVEDEGGDISERLCLECALRRGLAHYREEKGEKIITFFTGIDEDL